MKLKRIQEGLPTEHEVVLVHLEQGDQDKSARGRWVLAYYAADRWWFDVPHEVFDYFERYTGHDIPSGDNLVDLNFTRVTHWAKLPEHPEFILASDIELKPSPEVRYNKQERLVEVFGLPTIYTEQDPYYLEEDRFSTPHAALKSMAHLAGKTWSNSEGFLHRLASVLAEALEASRKPGR
jgi:hypothetical protein